LDAESEEVLPGEETRPGEARGSFQFKGYRTGVVSTLQDGKGVCKDNFEWGLIFSGFEEKKQGRDFA